MMKALNTNNHNNILYITSDLFKIYKTLCNNIEKNINSEYPLSISEIILLFNIYLLTESKIFITTSDLVNEKLFSIYNIIYILNSLAIKSCISLESVYQDGKSFRITILPHGSRAINYFNSIIMSQTTKTEIMKLGQKLSKY